MSTKKSLILISQILLFGFSTIFAQTGNDKALNSITSEELRDHIFFLASDYMAGRVATTPEYDIAAQYVASQFAAAGLQPANVDEDGSKSYFQGVPFSKTIYAEGFGWTLQINGKETTLEHINDFRILHSSSLNHDKLEIVYIGFGIEEPDNKWNDFKGLDVEGKIMVCIGGAPMKNGQPVLPKEVNDKYVGLTGFQKKIQALFSKGAAGIICVDVDGNMGFPFAMIPSEFTTEKYEYKGGEADESSMSIPSIYLVKPEFLNIIMAGNRNNPMDNPENIMANYKTQFLKDTYLTSKIEVLGEEPFTTNNIVGMVPGTDPLLKNEYIVVGGHLDHIEPVDGQVCNGADDNASGTSGVMEIAEAVAMNPCKRTVVFVVYTAEEMGLYGSDYFVKSGLFPKEQFKFNLNLDMIGRSDQDNLETRGHHVVTNKKYLDEINSFISEINDGITDFPLSYENDDESPGGSDHQSFISEGVPAFFFFSGMHSDLHLPGDDADKIDYAKAESLCRLGYLVVNRLANMETVPDFLTQ